MVQDSGPSTSGQEEPPSRVLYVGCVLLLPFRVDGGLRDAFLGN